MRTDARSYTLAVLGLGAMGIAIAHAAVVAGVGVRAWNRTPKTLGGPDVEASGVEILGTPAAAVAGADLVVLCVRDHAAARAVISGVAPHLVGAVLVNVSTGTPAETADSARRAAALGMRYVTGAVMVPTTLVGTDDCVVLYAGAADDLADLAPLSEVLSGTADLTGPDHAVPAALDLALLDIYFAGMYAHLHATALAEAHGISPRRFLPYARGIAQTLGSSMTDLTTAVEQRTWDGGEARLDMCLAFLDHIVTSSTEAGIAPGLAGVVRDASARALERVPGSTDWDVVAEDFAPTRIAQLVTNSSPGSTELP